MSAIAVRRTVTSVASLLTLGALALPVWAAPAASTPSAGATTDTLEEVIVTSEKIKETAQKTSISIETVSGEQMAQEAKNTVDAVLRDVPGVQVQGLAQGAQVFIRGVGSSIDPGFADPSIAMIVDGTYTGRTEAVVAGGYDIKQIEILRGPQGTVYGRNATGGLINVATNDPELDKFSGDVRAQFGNYGEVRGEAAVNLPLGEAFALRVAGFHDQHNDYVPNGGDDEHAEGGRAKLLFQPNDALRIVAKAELYVEDGNGPQTVAVPGSAGQLTFPPPFFTTNFNPPVAIPENANTCPGSPFIGCAPNWRYPNGWPTPTNSPWSESAVFPDGHIERRTTTVSLQADVNLGFGTLTVIPAYSSWSDALYSSYLFGTLGGYAWQTPAAVYHSLEARLTAPDASPIKWQVGAYYLHTKGGASGTTDVTGNDGSTFVLDQAFLPADTLAFYANTKYPVTDQFRLVGGLRWSRDTQQEQFQITDAQDAYNSGLSSYSNSQASTTWKAGIEYDLAPRSMLWATVSTGFKQGGISPGVPPVTFKPEYLTDYELGVKNRFLNDRLQLNGSVFYYDYRNYQLSFFNAQTLGSTTASYNAAVVTNAATSSIEGGDIELKWLATVDDQLHASITGLHAVYGAATLAPNPFAGPSPHSLTGRQMANAPDWTGQLGYDHTWHFGPGKLVTGVDARFSTSLLTTPEYYLGGATQSSYHVTDANVRYAAADDRWSVGAYVKNIENDAQTTYVFPAYRRFVTPPRTYGVNAEIRF